MQKILPWLLIVLSVAGIWLGMDLTDKHFRLIHQPEADFDSLCEVSETISCSKVNASKWSAIDFGGAAELPVSVPAVSFYVVMLLLALLVAFGKQEKRPNDLALMAAGMVPALIFSLWLVGIQAFAVKAWCLFCLGLDAVSLSIFVLAWVGHGGGVGGILGDVKSSLGKAALLAVVFGFVTYGVYGSYVDRVRTEGAQVKLTDTADKPEAQPEDDEPVDPEERAKAVAEAQGAVKEFLVDWPTLEAKEVKVNAFDAVKGTEGAPVTLIELADFECPHCRMAGYFLKDIAHRYGHAVQFVFKHYPLGTACNPNLGRDLHPDSCEAAVGAQCARRQGNFWDFHDQVFDHQGNLGTKTLMRISDELGLDRAEFEACIQKETLWDEVRTQVEDGKNLGISGTPAVFINGKELPSAHPVLIEAALREELKKAGVTDLPADPDGLFPL